MAQRKRITMITTGAVAALALTAGVAFATGTTPMAGDDDQPLTGATYDSAVAAALEHTGEGEVVETEVGDDGAAYEVEIVLPDGTQLEVELDESFTVIGSEVDDDTDEEDGTA